MYKNFFITLILLFFTKISIAEDIIVENAEARLPVNNISAIYFNITNNTDQDINIVSISASSVAEDIFLRNSYVDIEGIARTTNINKILLPAKTMISFKPQGIHIGISHFKKSINIGEKFPITIYFDKELKKTVIVSVGERSKK
jgi:copper(I)-binding protein